MRICGNGHPEILYDDIREDDCPCCVLRDALDEQNERIGELVDEIDGLSGDSG